MLVTCAAAVVIGIDQRLIDFLGGGQKAQELLASGAQPVDTTAAGDTFTGYFIASILAEMPIEEALRMCARASSITVSRMGATDSIPTMDEVKEALKG